MNTPFQFLDIIFLIYQLILQPFYDIIFLCFDILQPLSPLAKNRSFKLLYITSIHIADVLKDQPNLFWLIFE